MKIVKFVNFTAEDFTGKWDGRSKLIKAGQSLYVADYLGFHFAKHLVNRELTKQGLHNFTSPKKPEEVPQFYDLFKKAVIMDDHADDMEGMDIMDIKPETKHVEEDSKMAAKRGASTVIVAGPVDPDLKDADDESDFEDKEKENKQPGDEKKVEDENKQSQ